MQTLPFENLIDVFWGGGGGSVVEEAKKARAKGMEDREKGNEQRKDFLIKSTTFMPFSHKITTLIFVVCGWKFWFEFYSTKISIY